MNIIGNLVSELQAGASISDILRAQQRYHEYRRWSVYDVIRDTPATDFDRNDKAALWHAARAELTTQPAGIRLAIDGVQEAQKIATANPLGAKILHIAAAWSARYWLEEEAHHEVAYGELLKMSKLSEIEHDEVVSHRGFFPPDNYARVCMLQACVEIEASVTYGEMAKATTNPLVKEIFHRIMRDEVQHRQYFVSFAKALVDSGVYQRKDIFSMAYVWIRPDVGESNGSSRQAQSKREGFVNWWENIDFESRDLSLTEKQYNADNLHAQKVRSVLSAVSIASGVSVTSIENLKLAYYKSLMTNDPDRIRLAINNSVQSEENVA